MHIFSLDSKLMRILSRVGDLIILNVIYLFTCLPVFTIGAATAALYTVCFRFDTDREAGVVKPYFEAFRLNFRQGTQLLLILLPLLLVLALNVSLSLGQETWIRWLALPFGLLLLMVVFITAYAFPLLSQFENSTKQILRNARLLSIAYFPRSFLMAAILVLPFFLFLKAPLLFMQIGILWFILYFSCAAYLITRLFHKIFLPYWQQEEEAEDSAERS